MRSRRNLLALLPLVTIAAAPLARAEVGASGTRLAVGGGAPRFYMTYGHHQDPELYAPVARELARLQVTFQRRGDDYLVFHKGKKIGEWPIVTSREDVPETGEHPCILVMGGTPFVPVRKLEEMLPIRIRVDSKTNLVTLEPGPAKTAVRPTPPAGRTAHRPVPAPATGGATGGAIAGGLGTITPDGVEGRAVLVGLEVVEQGALPLQLRIRSTVPVKPNVFRLSNPERIVLDFENARWADGVQTPAAKGQVRGIRIGNPAPTTARVALDVESGDVKLTALDVLPDEIVASLGQGQQVARASLSREAEAVIQAIRRRQGPLAAAPASRHRVDTGMVTPSPAIDRSDITSVRPATTLVGRVIVVDPGHGGHSSGAKGLFSLEKDHCLKMSWDLRRALEARGATVLMTRETDIYVGLDERCQFANSNNADLFLSVHCNSTPRRNQASGSQTYWRTPQSLRLAQTLHPRLLGAVRGKDGGIRNQSFAVIRETRMPSVLLEIAYINNTQDEILLADTTFHRALAESLAEGVLEYFGTPVQP